jgi:RNA polymerase sigma factor (TIGR02999 family)
VRDAHDITGLLLEWQSGDRGALDRLTPVVYGELLKLARAFMRRERLDHTLSATALVHEAFLRLVDQRQVSFEGRAHFFGAAANIMRRILVDHAKKRAAAKRGGGQVDLELGQEDAPVPGAVPWEDVLALDEALEKLAILDGRKVRVVEMKFFGGMTNSEIALALATSEPTVERDWKMARAWLIRTMQA